MECFVSIFFLLLFLGEGWGGGGEACGGGYELISHLSRDK